MQHNTIKYITIQYNTIHYNTPKCNTCTITMSKYIIFRCRISQKIMEISYSIIMQLESPKLGWTGPTLASNMRIFQPFYNKVGLWKRPSSIIWYVYRWHFSCATIANPCQFLEFSFIYINTYGFICFRMPLFLSTINIQKNGISNSARSVASITVIHWFRV